VALIIYHAYEFYINQPDEHANDNASQKLPQMVQLPIARVAAYQRPFTYVGIDQIGPIPLTVGRRKEKRWGVILTCLPVRAVHLEIAHSLDASSCIMCIRNLFNRHGTPRHYFGPIPLTVGRRKEKRWEVIFTCIPVRAVHLRDIGRTCEGMVSTNLYNYKPEQT